MKSQRIITLLLCLLLVAMTLTSCGTKPDETYICEDLSFTIPADMKAYSYTAKDLLDMGDTADQQRYDVIFSNDTMVFRGKHLTEALLEKQGADPKAAPYAYAKYYTELNYGDDASKCGLTENKENGFATFTYGDSTDGKTYYYYYVTVLKATDGLWFIEMICEESARNTCAPTFRTWQKSLHIVPENA